MPKRNVKYFLAQTSHSSPLPEGDVRGGSLLPPSMMWVQREVSTVHTCTAMLPNAVIHTVPDDACSGGQKSFMNMPIIEKKKEAGIDQPIPTFQ